jgi:hypothetical protein
MFVSLLRTGLPDVGVKMTTSITFALTAISERFRLTIPLIHKGSEGSPSNFRHRLLIGLQPALPL